MSYTSAEIQSVYSGPVLKEFVQSIRLDNDDFDLNFLSSLIFSQLLLHRTQFITTNPHSNRYTPTSIIYLFMLYSREPLYIHIYICICMQNHNDDTIKTSDTVL